MAIRRDARENFQFVGDYKVSFFIDVGEEVKYVQYNENEDLILTGLINGVTKVYKEDKYQWEFTDVDIKNVPLTCMKHRPLSKNFPISNTMICSYNNGLIKCWNYNFKETVFSLIENRKTLSVTYHPKLAKFITMGDNKKIYLYDEDSKRQERVLTSSAATNATDGHTGSVICASFHPKTGNELITGGLDNTIQFWDTRQPHALRSIQGVRMVAEGLDFNDKGTEFLTCSSDKDKSIRIWDYGTAKEVKVVEPEKHGNMNFTCGRYINSDLIICAGGEPNLIKLVDLKNNQTVGSMSGLLKPIINLDVAEESTKIQFVFSTGKKIYNVVSSK